MPEFYHNLITEKSFQVLQQIKKKFNFILIGGWAMFLYTKALKSKDIDIIVDYDELEKLKREFNVFKNERLKKYEIKIEEVDIDIYLPYFSKLGFPVEEIQNYCQPIEGFVTAIPEILLLLKVQVFNQRRGTNKGKKDLIDIFSLLREEEIDWKKYKKIIQKYNLQETNQHLKKIITSASSLPELGLGNHQIAKLKKKTLKEL